jgi:hypothetical protein
MTVVADLPLPDMLKPLARLLDDPKPNVLMVIGTGISIGATGNPRSGWKGLLLDAVKRIESLGIETPDILVADRILIDKAFTGEFDLDEILQRAESIIRRLGGIGDSRYANWLKDSVGALKSSPDRRQSLEAISDLARAGALILTTNYDSLLSEATGFDPVTWEEPNKILEIINRKRKGIIHIHGHWARPSSIVLGRTSYDRIKSAALPQTELRSLWLQWHWLYLGCGSGGLDDPNLGALLQWTNDTGLNASALADYFLSSRETVSALPDRIGKSANLVKFAYVDHSIDLPSLLKGLAPETRASPFHRIGPDARRVRRPDESPLLSPFPSWQEYLDGSVPNLAADNKVIQRLNEHGWAFILDAASVGKTTLAYRIAARPEYRNTPAFHLLLSHPLVDETESDISPQSALARLTRPGVLFVIDDAHQRPELAHTLWQQWHERPMGSKLLILATLIERAINLPGDSSLHDLQMNTVNPAIVLQPEPKDLERIANYVLARLDGFDRVVLRPPQETSSAWHKAFGREIGAFVVAISQRRHELARGDFILPESAASIWVKERHLDRIDPPDVENAVCLALFGEQELEIDVPTQCLPHQNRMDRLLKSGLAEKILTTHGQIVMYGLREPGWGQLILAAVEHSQPRLTTMANMAARSIALALTTASRLRSHDLTKADQFWEQLATRKDTLAAHIFDGGVGYLPAFLQAAITHGLTELVDDLWATLESQPESLSNCVLSSSLESVLGLLHLAAACERRTLVNQLWRALAAQPAKLKEQAFRSSLSSFGKFLLFARDNGQQGIVSELWQTLATHRETFAERLGASTLGDVSQFLNRIDDREHNVIVEDLWLTLADTVVERAFKSTLGELREFLTLAGDRGQTRLIERVWGALAARSTDLVEQTFETTLNDFGAFLNAAAIQGQQTLIKTLCDALGAQPDRLVKQAFGSTLNDLGAFLRVAEKQGQQTLIKTLFDALGAQPNRLVEQAFGSTLNDLGAFLRVAEKQGQLTLVKTLYQLLAEHMDRLAERAFSEPIRDFGSFLGTAKKQGQDKFVDGAWTVLATQMERFAEHASTQLPNDLAGFLSLAPPSFNKELIKRFKVEDWIYDTHRTEALPGAAGLARLFGLNGREDLKIALVDNILRRKRPADFGDRRIGLAEISRLGSIVMPAQEPALVEILRIVCTENWLKDVYKFGSTVALARALQTFAEHLPPQVIRLVWNYALGTRLRKELSNFELYDVQGVNAVVQLLGASSLVGWSTNRAVLPDVQLDRIRELPHFLKHRPEANIVEQPQRQLWCGLRVLASMSFHSLHVDPTSVIETRNLWQNNIDGAGDWIGTKAKPDTATNRINLSMLKWLQDCAQTKTGRLLSNQEPLWVLVGFPYDPKQIAAD